MTHQWTDIQRKWVEALRSGGYQQATSWLFNDAGYCCLGVGYVAYTGKTPPVVGNLYCGTEADADRLRETQNALGLRSEDGKFAEPVTAAGEARNCLVELNDDAKWSFHEIADFIEAHPEQVFVQPEEAP